LKYSWTTTWSRTWQCLPCSVSATNYTRTPFIKYIQQFGSIIRSEIKSAKMGQLSELCFLALVSSKQQQEKWDRQLVEKKCVCFMEEKSSPEHMPSWTAKCHHGSTDYPKSGTCFLLWLSCKHTARHNNHTEYNCALPSNSVFH